MGQIWHLSAVKSVDCGDSSTPKLNPVCQWQIVKMRRPEDTTELLSNWNDGVYSVFFNAGSSNSPHSKKSTTPDTQTLKWKLVFTGKGESQKLCFIKNVHEQKCRVMRQCQTEQSKCNLIDPKLWNYSAALKTHGKKNFSVILTMYWETCLCVC